MLDAIINWRFAAKALAWGGAMLGVLQLRHLSGQWSHALCGPWGCGPTLESVVACHAVWIVLLTPAVVTIAKRLQPDAVAVCGTIAIVAGMLGLVGIGFWTVVVWYPEAASAQQQYVVQKYLYTIACLVDLPVIQMLLVGMVLKIGGRSNRHDSRSSDDTSLSASSILDHA